MIIFFQIKFKIWNSSNLSNIIHLSELKIGFPDFNLGGTIRKPQGIQRCPENRSSIWLFFGGLFTFDFGQTRNTLLGKSLSISPSLIWCLSSRQSFGRSRFWKCICIMYTVEFGHTQSHTYTHVTYHYSVNISGPQITYRAVSRWGLKTCTTVQI